MCLTSCNAFQNHLLSQKENLIFWPQKWIFEISEAIFDSFWHPNMRKRHSTATLKVSKKILRPSIKNRLDTIVQNVLGINLIPLTWSYDQNWKSERSKPKKRQKLPRSEPFEIIGFKCWLKLPHRKVLIKLIRKHFYDSFVSQILFSLSGVEVLTYAKPPLEITAFIWLKETS